jgi:tetratricopeptide (TPR) repeat protein
LIVRKIAYVFVACCATLLLQSGARGDIGSAVGLREMLHNCENNALAPDDRIKACTILLHSNLADPKMKGFLHALIGQAHSEAGDADEALKDYGMALESFPDYLPALINHGALEEHAGKYDVALADFDRAILAEPTNATALRDRCRVRLAMKRDLNGALADCNAALTSEPGSARALMVRGEVYTKLGRCAEAKADLDAAVKGDPSTAQEVSESRLCQAGLGGTSGGD